jgi:hypothetical protein
MRNLANRYLNLGYEHLASQPLLDFIRWSWFEEKLQFFAQIITGFLDGLSLTGHVQLRAQRHVSLAFPLDYRREFHRHLRHVVSISRLRNLANLTISRIAKLTYRHVSGFQKPGSSTWFFVSNETPSLIATPDRGLRAHSLKSLAERTSIAGTDCGLGGRVHSKIAWAKLRARRGDREQEVVELSSKSSLCG